jgi:hypothetical protein
MKLYSWYAHSWYFFPGPWMHELEIGFDLRRWMLGFSFAGKLYWLQLGPIEISYRAGL